MPYEVLQVLSCRAVGALEPAKKQGIFYALHGFVSERDLRLSRLTTKKHIESRDEQRD